VSKQTKLVVNTKSVHPVVDYSIWGLLICLLTCFILFSQFNKIDGMAMKLAYALVTFGVCTAVFSRTKLGQEAFSFAKSSRIEFLKIVWPTQQEAGRMTLLVIVAVTVLAFLLWVLDAMLFWLVRLITG
jgi:preprotein translocase subunit SecE